MSLPNTYLRSAPTQPRFCGQTWHSNHLDPLGIELHQFRRHEHRPVHPVVAAHYSVAGTLRFMAATGQTSAGDNRLGESYGLAVVVFLCILLEILDSSSQFLQSQTDFFVF